ncbi:hypothetical protein DL98DRAFT_573574 [Cadophora sp. DSE1049]|nr:hypothetical protein DL98DRAFT_573574 [Cadophora sp. DSE1049]
MKRARLEIHFLFYRKPAMAAGWVVGVGRETRVMGGIVETGEKKDSRREETSEGKEEEGEVGSRPSSCNAARAAQNRECSSGKTARSILQFVGVSNGPSHFGPSPLLSAPASLQRISICSGGWRFMFGALKDPELATVGAAPRQLKTLLAISHRLFPIQNMRRLRRGIGQQSRVGPLDIEKTTPHFTLEETPGNRCSSLLPEEYHVQPSETWGS